MVLLTTSISLAGSAIFFVTFSWITVFAAGLKKIFLKKDQTAYQWASLFVLTSGLCISALDARVNYGIEVFYGVLAGMGSAVVYSVYYIFCDIVGHLEDAPSPESLCAFDGLVGTWVLAIYILVFDGRQWEELVMVPVKEAKGSYDHIIISFVALALSYLVHQLSFFYIAKTSGCVLAGINKSVQTVTVFVVSTVFCGVQPAQCFSWAKAASVVVVAVGVLMYAHASSSAPGYGRKKLSEDEPAECLLQEAEGMGLLTVDGGGGAAVRRGSSADLVRPVEVLHIPVDHFVTRPNGSRVSTSEMSVGKAGASLLDRYDSILDSDKRKRGKSPPSRPPLLSSLPTRQLLEKSSSRKGLVSIAGTDTLVSSMASRFVFGPFANLFSEKKNVRVEEDLGSPLAVSPVHHSPRTEERVSRRVSVAAPRNLDGSLGVADAPGTAQVRRVHAGQLLVPI
jgi:drug/metabolite transporter (DMT)-like permease